MDTVKDDILNVEEAAELLHLTPPTVRKLATLRQIPGRKLGNKYWRFSRRQVLAYFGDEPAEPALATLQQRRRLAVKRATPPWANMVAIGALYSQCQALTRETGVPHHVDHQIPLQNPRVCGLHVETNLQILPGAANREKYNGWEGS